VNSKDKNRFSSVICNRRFQLMIYISSFYSNEPVFSNSNLSFTFFRQVFLFQTLIVDSKLFSFICPNDLHYCCEEVKAIYLFFALLLLYSRTSVTSVSCVSLICFLVSFLVRNSFAQIEHLNVPSTYSGIFYLDFIW
jgi:hypothetical protein